MGKPGSEGKTGDEKVRIADNGERVSEKAVTVLLRTQTQMNEVTLHS